MRLKSFLALIALAMIAAASAAAQQVPAQVVVTSAVPSASGDTLTITGENFGLIPLVTLDLVPLTIEAVAANRIVAVAPVKLMPPGTYLLTVSYGPSASETGSLQVALGDTPPTAPQEKTSGDAPGSTLTAAAQSDEVAARVGDRVITVAEVDREWRRTDPPGYLGLSRRLYDGRRRVVDAMVTNELLAREAAARGTTTEALLEEEIPKRMIAMPESAVLSLYQGLGARTRGATLEQMRPALRAWLERMTEPEIAKMNYVEELMKVSTRADVFLAAPRVHVERASQDATLGPDSALVEIVAFGDFQSSEYARFAQTFGKVRDTFGNRIRLVFKNLPVLGQDSFAAAEAAECAKAQSKFWPYHNALVAQPGAVAVERLRQSAIDAGLDRGAFEACVERGEFRAAVRRALDEGGRYGINSSPSFLVNGRLVSDPPSFLPPFDFFKRIIEEELLHQAKNPSAPRR